MDKRLILKMIGSIGLIAILIVLLLGLSIPIIKCIKYSVPIQSPVYSSFI